MGTTGLIFGAIVAAWLAYLVPMYLRRESIDRHHVFDPATRFSASVRIVQDGAAPGSGEPATEAPVSTPLIRRSMVDGIRRAERQAAGRRRNVILVLCVALAAVVTLCALGRTPWWATAIPGGLLVGFLAIARVSVRAMHRDFDRRLAAIDGGEDADDEDTVMVRGEDSGRIDKRKTDDALSVELGLPQGKPGTLWDPLPITRPTYVSAMPVGARTVRTIDLSAAPEAVAGDNKPVVADAPEPVVTRAQVAPVVAVEDAADDEPWVAQAN